HLRHPLPRLPRIRCTQHHQPLKHHQPSSRHTTNTHHVHRHDRIRCYRCYQCATRIMVGRTIRRHQRSTRHHRVRGNNHLASILSRRIPMVATHAHHGIIRGPSSTPSMDMDTRIQPPTRHKTIRKGGGFGIAHHHNLTSLLRWRRCCNHH